MPDYTTINVPGNGDTLVEDAQDELETELGFRPTKGKTVVHLAKQFLDNEEDDQ